MGLGPEKPPSGGQYPVHGRVVYHTKGEKGKVIGTLDRLRAFRECHPGAIYLHQAVQFLVEDWSLMKKMSM